MEQYLDVPDVKYFETFMIMHDDCSTYMSEEMLKSTFISELVFQFDRDCVGKPRCDIQFDYMKMPEKCLNEVIRRA